MEAGRWVKPGDVWQLVVGDVRVAVVSRGKEGWMWALVVENSGYAMAPDGSLKSAFDAVYARLRARHLTALAAWSAERPVEGWMEVE